MLMSLAPGASCAPTYRLNVIADELPRLRPLLRAVLAKRLGLPRHHADVEDAEAEVMRRAIEGRARLDSERPLRPWVLGIARHVAIDTMRRRGRSLPAEEAAADPVDPRPGPRERLQTRQRMHRFNQALAELPELQRKSLIMFHIDGRSYRAIAEELRVPLGSVCTWVARARRQVAEAMTEKEQ